MEILGSRVRMKESEVARGSSVTHLSGDNLMREQERRDIHHLVSSSIPSPPFPTLSILDPRAVLSAHLFASYAASNSESRFPLPLPISNNGGYHTGVVPHSAPLPTAQLDMLSSWVKEQANIDESRSMRTKRNTNIATSTPKSKKNKFPELRSLKMETVEISTPLISPSPVTHKQKTSRKKSEKNFEPIPLNNNNNNTHVPNNNTTLNNNYKNGKNTLQSQQSLHQSKDKLFTCHICNRHFGYKHVLQNHERTHTGEKPFECTICQKRFTRDHHLKTHIRLHTGEKPYKCEHCDKQFVQVANLRRHHRVHTGERPYPCEKCDSRFSDSNQLKAHSLIHRGEKPYACSHCNSRFRRRHHLNHHKCSVSIEMKESEAFEDESPRSLSSSKRERKSRETRRIIRLDSSSIVSTTNPFLPLPEQTHPEDLSLSSSINLHRFNGSHSSCSASPSPPSGGSNHGSSLGVYSHSLTGSSEGAEYSSDEERSNSNSTLEKTESDGASPLQI